MGRGRKPTPKPILKIRGSRIRGPHVTGIDAPPGIPAAPDWLGEVARSEWDRIVPMLEASKVMSPRHQQTLAAYCDSLADMIEADRELKANGATFMDDKGRVSNHPAWTRKRDARTSMRLWSAQPSATLCGPCRSIHGLPRLAWRYRLAFGGTPDAAACGWGFGLALGLHHDADSRRRIRVGRHQLELRQSVNGIGQGIRRPIRRARG